MSKEIHIQGWDKTQKQAGMLIMKNFIEPNIKQWKALPINSTEQKNVRVEDVMANAVNLMEFGINIETSIQ